MIARTVLGFALLTGCLAVGALVGRLRRSARPVVRTAAARVHWAAGVVAVAFLALLAVTAVQLLL